MNSEEIKGFFAKEEEIDNEAHVIFTYIFETTGDVRMAAAHLCSETSTAQWKRPDVDEDLRPRHAAKVLSIEELDEARLSAFGDTAEFGEKFRRAKVRIAHPYENFGSAIPNLLTVAMGEGAFFCGGISSIKLVDIDLPSSYLKNFQGPKFGIKGMKNILDVTDRPLFFGVVKPNIGLDPKSFTELAYEAWSGGLDAAKDDEMMADPNYSPFALRMKLAGEAMRRAEDETGEKKMFIANITDEVDRLLYLHDIAVENGINAVMVNVMAVGLSAVRMLRKHSKVPIVAHFDCIAPMSRHPRFGVSTTVLTKLQRLCGCDAIIMPGFGSRMMTPDEEVLANVTECTKLLGEIRPSLPAPGGSDWAGTIKDIYSKLRTLDFAAVPGRGVFGHPMGPRAGAKSLRQAWEAILYRASVTEYAETHPELKAAIEEFGGKNFKDDAPVPEGITITQGYTGASIQILKSLN